jgi:hypothetical protein
MERNIKEKLFKFLFPNEYKELEEKRKKIKILNESIIHLKIELKERDTQLSGCIGEVTRLKMSTGRLEYELKMKDVEIVNSPIYQELLNNYHTLLKENNELKENNI